jgi:hypothetical protein
MSDGSNGVIANPLWVKCLGKACWNPWASPRKDAKTRAPRPLSTLLRIRNVARNIWGYSGLRRRCTVLAKARPNPRPRLPHWTVSSKATLFLVGW